MRLDRLGGLAWVLVATACGGTSPKGSAVKADLVLIARRFITLDDPAEVQALAVRGGRIAWLGAAADVGPWVGPHTKVLRRAEAVVVPGLVDSHAHLAGLGRALDTLDLVGTPSARAVADEVRAVPPGEGWITGRGWDQNDWARTEFPDHHLLTEAAPSRPVALRRVDGHALWVNRAAMVAAGLSAQTPDPPGGRLLRDATGAPTGVLIDGAMALVDKHLPPPTDAQVRGWLTRAIARCHAAGLTGVHDAGVSAQVLRVYRQMAGSGALPLRVYAMLDGADPEIEALIAAGPTRGERLSVGAVKLFADGALGSRGAWLSAPYADAPGESGIPTLRGEPLRAQVRRANAAGFQVGVHAIGDRAVTEVLDAYEQVLGETDRRPRLEHAQVVRPADRARMARLGVLAMMQPTHATSDMSWAEARLGPERIHWAYAWQALRAAGVRVALGSDFPVERPDVVEGIYAAVTRMDRAGEPAGGWMPDQRLSPEQALRGFTEEPAFASFEEAHRGRLAVGMDADLTLLAGDPLSADPGQLRALRVLGVVVAGEPHGGLVDAP